MLQELIWYNAQWRSLKRGVGDHKVGVTEKLNLCSDAFIDLQCAIFVSTEYTFILFD